MRYLLDKLDQDATVGVVTPFTAQQQSLERRLRGMERVRVGTVHTFPGGERDAIVLSLVAGEGISPGGMAWMCGQLHLWNVAITRARAHLVIVGDRGRWEQRGGVGAALVSAAQRCAIGVDGTEAAPADDLVLASHARRSELSGVDFRLGVPLDGYVADAVISDGSRTVALLLDRGHDAGRPARHLRLEYERCRLVADPATGGAAVRVPAWRLFDTGPDALSALTPPGVGRGQLSASTDGSPRTRAAS